MATRDISTRVTIEGDKGYRDALSSINKELKAVNAELKAAEAAFESSGGSQEAATARTEALSNATNVYQEKIKTLQDAIQNAEAAQSKYNTAAEASKAALEKTQDAISKLDEKTVKNGETWNTLSDRLKNAQAAQEALGERTEENAAEYDNYQAKIDAAKAALDKLDAETNGAAASAGALLAQEQKQTSEMDKNANAAKKCADRINEYRRQLANSNKELSEVNSKLGESSEKTNTATEAFQSLNTVMLTLGVKRAINEIADALGECVDAAANFEYAMSTVEAVSGSTEAELGALEKQAIDYSTSTIHTAQDLSQAYATLARAGWTSSEMLDGMGGIMSLASAAGEDLNTVVSYVSDSLNAFGYSASDAGHYADVLAEAAGDSNTTVALMGESFKMVATTAGNLGYSVDDVAVALAAMANNALKGEMSGTALSTALTRMSGANQTAAKEMDALGLSMYNADGTAKDLSVFLGELRAKFAEFGNDAEAAQVAAYKLAGQRGMKGLLAVVNTSDADWQKLTDSINNCEDAAETMSEVQLDNYTGQVKLLESAEEALRIEIGQQLTPALEGMAETLTNVVTGIRNFITEHKSVVPVLTGATTALATFTAGITACAVAARAIAAIKAVPVIASLIGPLGLVAAGIGIVTAGVIALKPATDEARDAIVELQGAMSEQAEGHQNTMSGIESEGQANMNLANTLNSLVAAYDGSASSAAEINNVVNQLNEAVPSLSLSFDENTGALNMNSEALEKMIQQQMIYDELVEAISNRNTLKDQYLESCDALTQTRAAYEAATEALATWNAENEGGYNYELESEVDRTRTNMEMAQETASGAANAYNFAQMEVNELKNAYDGAGDATEQHTEQMEESSDAAVKLSEDEQEVVNTLKEIGNECRNATGSGDELMSAYEELKKEYEKLDGAGSEWRRNLVEQQLQTLKVRAMTAQLAEQLPNLSVSYKNLAQAIEDTGYSVDQFVDDYQNAMDTMVSGFDELEYDTNNTLKKWLESMNQRSNVEKTWNENTAAIVNALSDGTIVDKAKPAYQQAVSEILSGGVETYGQVASDLAKAIAANDGGTAWALVNSVNNASTQAEDAAIIAFANATGRTTDAVREMLASGAAVWQDEAVVMAEDATAITSAVASAVETGTADTESAVQALVQTATNAILSGDTEMAWANGGKVLVQYMATGMGEAAADLETAGSDAAAQGITGAESGSEGANAVGAYFDSGFAQGISSNSGSVYSAAFAVGQLAYKAAMAGTDAHSPSKLAAKVGMYFDQGLAGGIKKNAVLVDDAVTAMTDDAMAGLDALTRFPEEMVSTNGLLSDLSNEVNVDEHDWTITVNAAQGQDENAIANAVMSKINANIKRTKGAR